MKQLRALESIIRGFLYFSPVAANSENEAFLQTSQSLLDCIDVIKANATSAVEGDHQAKIRLCLKLLETLQLAIEMSSQRPDSAVLKLEAVKFALRLLAWRRGERLGAPASDGYVGSLSGLRLKPLPAAAEISLRLFLSDFVKCLAPLLYAAARARAPAGALTVYATLQVLSLSLLQDREEFRDRARLLVLDLLVRRPVYQLTLRRPLAGLSDMWSKIPLLRELNYLEYAVSQSDRVRSRGRSGRSAWCARRRAG